MYSEKQELKVQSQHPELVPAQLPLDPTLALCPGRRKFLLCNPASIFCRAEEPGKSGHHRTFSVLSSGLQLGFSDSPGECD